MSDSVSFLADTGELLTLFALKMEISLFSSISQWDYVVTA